jgi:hypothetical protein
LTQGEFIMLRFESARIRLLLRDIELSTRGQMAGLEIQRAAGSEEPLEVVADRLALVRLGAHLASAGLSAASEVAIDHYGHLCAPGGEGGAIKVTLTEKPLPELGRSPGWSPTRWLVFAAGVLVGAPLGAVLHRIVS